MISSKTIEAPAQIFYRKSPALFSFGFMKHAIITLLRRKRTFQGMTIPNLLSDMSACRITKSVALPIEYQDGISRSAQLIEGCRNIPELIPFCSVHPQDPEKFKKLDAYMQSGAKGLKLHPNFQRIRPDAPESIELYEAYTRYRLPLIIHSGLTGRERRVYSGRNFSALQFVESIPKNFPTIPFVLAHAGISQYKIAIMLAQKYKNVYLELSGQPACHIQHALAEIGADRLLFGTDWPFWKQTFGLQAVCQATQYDQAAKQQILSKNAECLLHIDAD